MNTVLAFDVYGTLIDTAGVITALEEIIGDRAGAFSDLWRQKQLEYSFRRALMQNYRDFAVCTLQALDYACLNFCVQFSPEEKENLMKTYRILPPFPDVPECLEKLREGGFRMFACSNGRADDVLNLLRNAGLEEFFEGVVSTGDIQSYKPNPAVYAHFLRQSGAAGTAAWMISSNPFDVIGAVYIGMRAAWVRRSHNTVFDPWETRPTITVEGLAALPAALERYGIS